MHRTLSMSDIKVFTLRESYLMSFMRRLCGQPPDTVVQHIEDRCKRSGSQKGNKVYIIHKDCAVHLWTFSSNNQIAVDDLKFHMNKFINSIIHDFDENQIYIYGEQIDNDSQFMFYHDDLTAYLVGAATDMQRRCASRSYNTSWKKTQSEEEGAN